MPDPGEPTTGGSWPPATGVPTVPATPANGASAPLATRISRRQVQRRLDAELATVRAELARVDAKTSTLLGLAGVLLGGGLAVLGSVGDRLPVGAVVAAWAAAAAVGAAVVLLALAVRPNLRDNYGFVRWCQAADAGALLDELATDTAGDPLTGPAGQLRWLSYALVAKYGAVRRAVTLLVAGLAGGTVAAALAMWAR